MAKVLVAFFNGVEDENNPNAIPAYYESFVNGLDKAGNEVAVFWHRKFRQDFEEIDESTSKIIADFSPELCIIFNNSFYDLSSVVSCPIIIWEVDSPRYFANKQRIKEKADRYLYFIAQLDSKETIMREYGVKEDRIFYAPFFTEVHADDEMTLETNISFIGSRFTSSIEPFRDFVEKNPTQKEWLMFQNCVNEIRRNPQVTPTELVYKYNVTSELVARNLNIAEILMMLSGEKRHKVLSAVADLGLDLYGTKNWNNEYYLNIDLNFSYVDKRVYSLKHTQDIYNQSKIGINVSHLQATSGFPWRVMDIMASNACLVTDYHSDITKLFPEVTDVLPIYENAYEAYDICKKLLDDEPRRREIVRRCNDIINERYRFKNLLFKMEEYMGVTLHQK